MRQGLSVTVINTSMLCKGCADILFFQRTKVTPLSLPLTALALLYSCCLLDKNDDDTQLAKCSYLLTAPTQGQLLFPQPSLKSCKTNPTTASY